MLLVLRKCSGPPLAPLKALAGLVVGDTVLIILSFAGFAELMRAFPHAFGVLRLVGAGYIACLGWKTIRAPIVQAQSLTDRGDFVQALLLTLSNPKSILFFAAFFPLFAGTASPGEFGFLGVIFECVNVSFYLLFVTATRWVAKRFDFFASRKVNLICGSGLIIAALFSIAISGVSEARGGFGPIAVTVGTSRASCAASRPDGGQIDDRD